MEIEVRGIALAKNIFRPRGVDRRGRAIYTPMADQSVPGCKCKYRWVPAFNWEGEPGCRRPASRPQPHPVELHR
jgi:hypothetical protein